MHTRGGRGAAEPRRVPLPGRLRPGGGGTLVGEGDGDAGLPGRRGGVGSAPRLMWWVGVGGSNHLIRRGKTMRDVGDQNGD